MTAPNSCSVGGAYKAFWCWKRLNEGDEDELAGSSSGKSFEACVAEAKKGGLGRPQGVDDGLVLARQAESLGKALEKLGLGKGGTSGVRIKVGDGDDEDDADRSREMEEMEEEEEEECKAGLEVVATPDKKMYAAYEGMVAKFKEAEGKTCGR